MFKRKKKVGLGFSMVELLVVLVIIAILAAVAAPIYLANTKRAMASDAVSTMSLIRQAEREHRVRTGGFLEGLTSDQIATNLAVNVETTQYFSQAAFTVEGDGTDFAAADPSLGAQGFLIEADATQSDTCPSNAPDCAVKNDAKAMGMKLQMDNSGRIKVAYDGTHWENY